MNLEPSAKKQALQGVFDRSASTYGSIRYFPLLGQWLVEMAQIPGGVVEHALVYLRAGWFGAISAEAVRAVQG
jgi:hypothetical protein